MCRIYSPGEIFIDLARCLNLVVCPGYPAFHFLTPSVPHLVCQNASSTFQNLPPYFTLGTWQVNVTFPSPFTCLRHRDMHILEKRQSTQDECTCSAWPEVAVMSSCELKADLHHPPNLLELKPLLNGWCVLQNSDTHLSSESSISC